MAIAIVKIKFYQYTKFCIVTLKFLIYITYILPSQL